MRVDPLACPPLPAGAPNLVLAGFMGVGKTTVGRRAAELLGMPFFDLDREIERSCGKPVAKVFELEGEPAFRRLEASMLAAAARLSGAVLAVGGGAVLHREEFSQLAGHSITVRLECSEPELARRLEGARDERPLLRERPGGRQALLEERGPLYAALGPGLDTTGKSVGEAAAEAAATFLARRGSASSLIRSGDTVVTVREGGVASLGSLLAGVAPGAARVIVVAERGLDRARREVITALRSQGLVVRSCVLTGGEAGKTLPRLAALWRRLAAFDADRGDVLVAVGGGALLDLAGMAAATFARGLPLVNVPTTVLAMADAAVGGKVAIDFGGRKNAVGCFHPARLVVCDPRLLGRRRPEVWDHGLAEVLKCAVLGSPLTLARFGELGSERSTASVAFLVEQALRVKLAYVRADPEDQGVRLALNLGHTYAHALEAASEYRLAHGEAVAIGLLAAARLGAELNLSDPGLEPQLAAALAEVGLPRRPPSGLSRQAVMDAWRGDKKRRAGRQRVVVPAAVGTGAHLVTDLDPDLALGALWAGGDHEAVLA